MENKICSACSAVNEPNYIFCIKCGSALNSAEGTADYTQNAGYGQYAGAYNQPFSAGGYGPAGAVDGISAEEAAAYIGPKAHHYLPKFQEMSANGSKSSFNVMLFVLSFFLLGPIFAGYWLISKKVYKQGIIICTVFTLFSLSLFAMYLPVINTYITVIKDSVEYATEQSGASDNYSDASIYINEYIEENLLSDKTASSFALMMGASIISSIINMAFSIVFAIKANYWYKNNMVRKINEARGQGRGSLAEISAMGGTSALWAAFLAANILVSVIFSSLFASRFLEIFL